MVHSGCYVTRPCADTNLATQASIIAGFAFDGLVELEAPEHVRVAVPATLIGALDLLRV